MSEYDDLMAALEVREIDLGDMAMDSISIAYRAFKANPPLVAELEAERDTFYNDYNDAVGKLVELEAENERLREAIECALPYGA